MLPENPTSPAAPENLLKRLAEPLRPGDMGVLMAGAGVGKTACLTLIALDHLFRGAQAIHVCIDGTPEKIKVWYHELLKNIAAAAPGEDPSRLLRRIEPLRFILTYLHQTFSIEKLDRSLLNLREQAKFSPAMMVLDGLDFDRASRSTIESLRAFAQRQGVSVWMSARTHRHISVANERGIPYPCHESDDLFQSILLLEPLPDAIRMKVLKRDGAYTPACPEVFLDPETYLLRGI